MFSYSLTFPQQQGFVKLGEMLDRLKIGGEAEKQLQGLRGYIDDCKRNWDIIDEVRKEDKKHTSFAPAGVGVREYE